jgi:hypothetical protein
VLGAGVTPTIMVVVAKVQGLAGDDRQTAAGAGRAAGVDEQAHALALAAVGPAVARRRAQVVKPSTRGERGDCALSLPTNER